MQWRLTLFFFISWMDLSRTYYTKLGVSSEYFAFIAALTCAMGNVGMGCFFCLAPLHVRLKFPLLYICAVYFTSVLVVWQYINHWSFFCIWSWLYEDNLIFILLFVYDDTAQVCITIRLWMLPLRINPTSKDQCIPGSGFTWHLFLLFILSVLLRAAWVSCTCSLHVG